MILKVIQGHRKLRYAYTHAFQVQIFEHSCSSW